MNRSYWEQVSEDYEREVVSVLDHDARGRVRQMIAEAGMTDPTGTAADLGCGVGKFTALLAEGFAQVEACDFSQRGLDIARERCEGQSHVHFHLVDLTCDPMPFQPVDFALCVNVLLMPCLDERLRAWRAVTNQVRTGGQLLLVVPALESILMERHNAVDAALDSGRTCDQSLEDALPEDTSTLDLHQGVHRLGGLRTKHYFGDELRSMLQEHAFVVEQLERLEYRSVTTGKQLPSWDWLALARRV